MPPPSIKKATDEEHSSDEYESICSFIETYIDTTENHYDNFIATKKRGDLDEVLKAVRHKNEK
jgi:hypothetical protein